MNITNLLVGTKQFLTREPTSLAKWDKAVFNWRIDVIGKISDQEPVESMAELLKMIMIWQMPESK